MRTWSGTVAGSVEGEMTEAAQQRILVTGGSGFVGGHVIEALRVTYGPGCLIVNAGPSASAHPAGVTSVHLDLRSATSIVEALQAVRPTACLHLAGLTHVPGSSRRPAEAWSVNVAGTIALGEAILEHSPNCRLVHVSSGEVYGRSATSVDRLDEDVVLAPANTYAVTKAAADLAVGELALRGLRAVRIRPFNHTGPGQSESFVVPAIAAQVARAEAGLAPAAVRLGSLESARDFLDVRDVAQAYVRAVERFDALPNGIVINLASGVSRSIGQIARALIGRSRRPLEIQQDPSRLRAADVPSVCGDAQRASTLLGWRPTIPFDTTLDDVLTEWRARVGSVRAEHAR